MLLVVEKGIRGRTCHAIHRHAKANKKYMKKLSMVSNGRKKFIILMNILQKILMKIVIRDVFLK